MTSGESGSRGSGWATQGLSLFRVLARRWFVVVIVAVGFTGAALVYSKGQPAVYGSSGSIFLNSSSTALTGGTTDAAQVLRTQASLAVSTPAVDSIATKLKLTHDYVASHVTVTPAAAGYFFTITAKSSTPAGAEALVSTAEAVYQQVASGLDTTTLTNLQNLATKTQARLTELRNSPNAATDSGIASQITAANALLTRISAQEADLQISTATNPSIVQLVETPQPATQVAPTPTRNGIVAGLVGLFLSAGLIWLFYMRHPTVVSGKAASDILGVPVLAEIAGGRGSAGVPTEAIVTSMSAVLSPTVKVVALSAGGSSDLAPDLVAGIAASWSDEQGVVLVLDAAPQSSVRSALERLPRASSGDLPSWASDPTCLARSSGKGHGNVLYNRVAPSRAARPGGLAPILADRAPVVDLVLLLTPALSELPVSAASALQADVVIVLTSTDTPTKALAEVVNEWPGLGERIVGVVHDGRSAHRRSAERRSKASAVAGGSGPVLDEPVHRPDRMERPVDRERFADRPERPERPERHVPPVDSRKRPAGGDRAGGRAVDADPDKTDLFPVSKSGPLRAPRGKDSSPGPSWE